MSSITDLQKIIKRAEAAEARLQNMETEIRAVMARRKALSDEIEAEIQQAKQHRQAELSELERIHDETMRQKETESRQVRDEAARYRVEKLALEKEVNILRDETAHAKATLNRVQNDIKSEGEELKALEHTTEAANIQNERIAAQLSPLKAERSELTGEVAMLRGEKTTLMSDISYLTSDYESKAQEYDRRLSLLMGREQEMNLKLKAARGYVAQMTEEAAVRIKALDERELVLTRRERNVEQGEAQIARNSNFLKL